MPARSKPSESSDSSNGARTKDSSMPTGTKEKPPVRRTKPRLNQPSNIKGSWPGFSSIEHSAGLSVSALSEEISTATEIVIANCR